MKDGAITGNEKTPRILPNRPMYAEHPPWVTNYGSLLTQLTPTSSARSTEVALHTTQPHGADGQ